MTVDRIFQRLLADLVDWSPVEATRLGDHSRDGDLDDWDGGEADRRLRAVAELRAQLDGLRPEADAETAGDALLVGDALDSVEFELARLRSHERDPQFYLGLATASVYELIRRDDLPAEPRREAVAARAALVPRLLEQSRRLLCEVPEPHRDLALLRLPGAVALFTETVPAFAPRAGEAGRAAAAACRELAAWLESLTGPFPDWRLGEDLWADALRLALGVRMSPADLWRRAHHALAEGEEAMERLASQILGADAAGRRGADLVRAAVDRASQDRVARPDLVPRAAAVLADIKTFIAATGVFDLPEPDTLRVDEVPAFLRGAVVAYFVPAPALETDAAHTYYLSPVPDDWTDEQASSFLREYNVHALRSVGIHEAYPGHYVQLAHAQRHPRLLRRVLWNSAFAEGWAVYAEQRLIDLGFGEHVGQGPAMRLISAKMDLRSIANALLDQGLHVHGWSDDKAMELMTSTTYQERAEAEAKLMRAKTGAGQLSTYFVGSQAMHDLRHDVERADGASFDEAAFHRQVLAQGTPPFEVLHTALLQGEPA